MLSEKDRHIIESGDLYEDQLIFDQHLLKQQFTQFNGLRLTLLERQPHSEATTNALQILHINSNHWVVAATKARLCVYDTLFSSVDQATTGIIKTNFQCNVQNIQLVPMLETSGWFLLGTFCLAIATSIAFGENPTQ